MSRRSDFITEVRDEATNILNAVDNLQALRREWTALDYANTLEVSDFEGANEDATVAEVSAVVGTTLDALQGLLDAGHATNLNKIRH